jgi:hypothetical protein
MLRCIVTTTQPGELELVIDTKYLWNGQALNSSEGYIVKTLGG